MAITKEQIDRINELAKKSKTVGLTPEEREEQTLLRKEYIAGFKKNLKSQLDNISIVEKDGSVIPLTSKDKNKRH